MNPKRTRKLQAMATPSEVEAFISSCVAVGLQPPDTLRKLALAFASHVKEQKSITIPLRIRFE